MNTRQAGICFGAISLDLSAAEDTGAHSIKGVSDAPSSSPLQASAQRRGVEPPEWAKGLRSSWTGSAHLGVTFWCHSQSVPSNCREDVGQEAGMVGNTVQQMRPRSDQPSSRGGYRTTEQSQMWLIKPELLSLGHGGACGRVR